MRCQCAAGEKKRIESQLWGMSSLMFYNTEVRKQRWLLQQLVLSVGACSGRLMATVTVMMQVVSKC